MRQLKQHLTSQLSRRSLHALPLKAWRGREIMTHDHGESDIDRWLNEGACNCRYRLRCWIPAFSKKRSAG